MTGCQFERNNQTNRQTERQTDRKKRESTHCSNSYLNWEDDTEKVKTEKVKYVKLR